VAADQLDAARRADVEAKCYMSRATKAIFKMLLADCARAQAGTAIGRY
jgi:hypothetical protein